MEAERRLLIAALADVANQRFVLLSESCVPLFPPATVWLQLMQERRSRLNACARNDTADIERRMIFRRARQSQRQLPNVRSCAARCC